MPIYLVKVPGSPPTEKLVDASNRAAAIRHAIKGLVTADPLTATELARLFGKGGVIIETARQDPIEDDQETGKLAIADLNRVATTITLESTNDDLVPAAL